MAVPKRKVSPSRKRLRHQNTHLKIMRTYCNHILCHQCSSVKKKHSICTNCGVYTKEH